LLAADDTFALSNRLAQPMDRQQRGFWIALGCALVLHSALLVEANRSAPRRVGSAEGSNDAIAVEIVTEADLKSRETVAVPQSGAPPVPPPQPQSAPEPAPQPPPEPEAKAAEPAPTPPPPAPQPKQEAAKPANDFDLPDLADVAALPEKAKPVEEPAEKEVKAEPAEKQSKPEQPKKKEQKKQQQQARLDPPASPRDAPQAAPNRGSSFSRPPGITQSGENDEFGRGVIRALRATMPPPAGIYGRVTVRLLLNENGDLSQVQVVESSGIPNLDQSIVFATKQSNFPLPPVGSTVADRTFLISYVYR
jgi:TonB family protein